MRTLLILVLCITFIDIMSAQKIVYEQDMMTDDYSFYFVDSKDNTTLLVSEDGNEGFYLSVFFKESLKKIIPDKLTPTIIYAKMALEDLGCVEGGFMIIRFEDGSKFQINNWKKFNCESEFYFNLTNEHLTQLYSKKIDKIMIQDGRSHKSYTNTPRNPEFFMELKKALDSPMVKK